MRILHPRATAFAVLALVLAWSAVASAQPCMIFVHGKQTDTNTYTNWNSARNYWKNGSNDFIQAATKNFATSYYVVGYNGTRPYYESQSAGEVAERVRVGPRRGVAEPVAPLVRVGLPDHFEDPLELVLVGGASGNPMLLRRGRRRRKLRRRDGLGRGLPGSFGHLQHRGGRGEDPPYSAGLRGPPSLA